MTAARKSKLYWNRAATTDPAWYTATGFHSESQQFFESGTRDVDHLLEIFGVQVGKDSTLLELGSGIGRMTRRLSERAGRVIASDVSPLMLQRAKQNLSSLDSISFLELEGDGSIPLESASLDVVFSYITMQHVIDPSAQEQYFSEALRVIRPGGWVVMQFRLPGLRMRLRDLAAHVVNVLRGKRTLSRAWRGSYLDGRVLRSFRTQKIGVDVLRIDDAHIWAVARRVLAP